MRIIKNIFLTVFYMFFYLYLISTSLYLYNHRHKIKNIHELKYQLAVLVRSDFNYFLRSVNIFSRNLNSLKYKHVNLSIMAKDQQEFNLLPVLTGTDDKTCRIKIDNFSYNCEWKLHSDNYWHWNTPQKSLRIDLTNRKFNKMSSFSLIKPKSLFFPMEIIYSKWARHYGLLAPYHEIVLGTVNGEYIGVYLLREELNEDYYLNNNFAPGYMVESKLSFISHHGYAGVKDFPRKNQERFEKDLNLLSWELESSFHSSGFNSFFYDDLESIFNKKFREKYELDYLARFFAFHSIFAVYHFDAYTNNLNYIDLEKNKIYFIVQDILNSQFLRRTTPRRNLNVWNLVKEDEEFLKFYHFYLRKMLNEDGLISKIRGDIKDHIDHLENALKSAKTFTAIYEDANIMGLGRTHYFLDVDIEWNYSDFKNQGYLEMANFTYRESLLDDYLKSQNTQSIKTPRKTMNSKILKHSNKDKLELGNKNYENQEIYITNVDEVIIRNSRFNKSSLVIGNVETLKIEGIEFNNVFGNALSIYNIGDVKIQNFLAKNILKSALKCSHSKINELKNSKVTLAFQDIENDGCEISSDFDMELKQVDTSIKGGK